MKMVVQMSESAKLRASQELLYRCKLPGGPAAAKMAVLRSNFLLRFLTRQTDPTVRHRLTLDGADMS